MKFLYTLKGIDYHELNIHVSKEEEKAICELLMELRKTNKETA